MTIIKISGNWLNKRISVNGTVIENKKEFSWGNNTESSRVAAYCILCSSIKDKRKITTKKQLKFHKKIIANLPQSDFNMAVDITEFI